ncbi:MAG TPA: YjzC family protein, partial [Ktedonobacteraceae bacterium]
SIDGGAQMSARQKPGQTPRRPGEYRERGPNGGGVNDPRTVTMPPGDKPLPPTQRPGHTWERIGPPQPDKGSK